MVHTNGIYKNGTNSSFELPQLTDTWRLFFPAITQLNQIYADIHDL